MLLAAPVADYAIARSQAILLCRFASHGRVFPWRRPGLTQYESVIADALLQRTRADIVAKHYEGFLRAFPDWRALAATDVAGLKSYIYPLVMAT